MDHISQLKKIRAEAIARLRTSSDFKLAGKLGQLIVELGETVEDVAVFDDPILATPKKETVTLAPVVETPRPFESSFLPKTEPEYTELKSDEMIDDLVAEIEGDAAELDALMAETAEKPKLGNISSYFKSEKADASPKNGAAH